MDTASAYLRGRAATVAGARRMVFDWDRAAQIMRDCKALTAGAGLSYDWEWTGGTILKNGMPVLDGGTYLASNWAIPELQVDGDTIPCWRYTDETPGWNAKTVWPESARLILSGRRSDVI